MFDATLKAEPLELVADTSRIAWSRHFDRSLTPKQRSFCSHFHNHIPKAPNNTLQNWTHARHNKNRWYTNNDGLGARNRFCWNCAFMTNSYWRENYYDYILFYNYLKSKRFVMTTFGALLTLSFSAFWQWVPEYECHTSFIIPVDRQSIWFNSI